MDLLKNLGSLGLHTIEYPDGSWGFVGTVPMALAYEMADGSPVSAKMAGNIKHAGPGLFLRAGNPDMKIRRLSWPTEAAAIEAAAALGYAV